MHDLIQLNYEVTNDATIKLKNLYDVYDIPINASLKYVDSYCLTYYSTNKNWNFRIKIKNKNLPENSYVNIDLFTSSTGKVLAKCKHQNYYLYCEFTFNKPSTYLIQISPIKLIGSVDWENLDYNTTIPINYTARSFDQPRFLELIDGQWNYRIYSAAKDTMGSLSTLITINTKIKSNNGNEYIYLTRCYLISDATETKIFSCTVFGEHQEMSDIVYVTNSNTNDISVDWNGKIKEDQLIVRNAELSFIKIYDHEYVKNWVFKILVGNDDDLPEDSIVYVDVYMDSSYLTANYYAICTKNNHILNCDKISGSTGQTYLMKFQSEKVRGSVTWTNLKQKYISIPLNYKLTFSKAYNGFFTDRWNFLIDARHTGYAPRNSKVVIDILQNTKETTASCEILKIINGNENFYLFCVSDSEAQSINDIIIISSTKKQGSVTWNTEITESNNIVEKISLENDSEYIIPLNFIDADNMYFSNNRWIFTIKSRFETANNVKDKVGLYKVDISITKATSKSQGIALCLLYEGEESHANARFLCYSDYANQQREDLLKITKEFTDDTTVSWLKGMKDTEVSITLNSIMTIDKAYNLTKTNNNYWYFNIDVVNDDDIILPLNSKVIVDLHTSSATYTANCTCYDYYKLFCGSTDDSTEEPSLVYTKSQKSSVEWTNENMEDYYIIRTANLSLISVQNLYFKDSKWHFNISTTGLSSAKVIIDIYYNTEATTATCYGGRGNMINCVVDKDIQENSALIKLSKTKTDSSTITWTNLNEDKKISLWTKLSFEKTNNLHMVDNEWNFDIYIKNNNIPEGSFIIVDVKLLYYYGTSELYIRNLNSIANCIHSSKKLSCDVVIERSNDKRYYYSTSLLKTKNENSVSSVYQWNDMPEDIMPITLVSDLKFFYANKIIKEKGRNIFYIELDQSTKIPKESICTIDIIINSENRISNCTAQNHTTLKCEIDSNDNVNNKKVYIAKDKTPFSSITWTNLNINQNLFSMKLTYIYSFNFTSLPYTTADFNIIATGLELKNDLIIPVKFNQQRNAKMGTMTYEKIFNISCECKNYILNCHLFCGTGFYDDKDKYFLMLREQGDTIEWNNPGNISNIIGQHIYNLYYDNFIYCYYDEKNNYYIFSISLERSVDNINIYYIIDLKINEEDSYGVCSPKDARTLECFSNIMTRNNVDKVLISKNRNIGNSIWVGITDRIQIYPNNYAFADCSKIYGLQYDNSNKKWEFNIKYDYITTFAGSKEIEILLGTEEKTANCEVTDSSNKIVTCSSGVLSEPVLIQLNDKYVSNEHLCLYNLKYDGIPLVASLEFQSAYDLKYEDGWSFELKAKILGGANILQGSTLSVDIIYDTNKQELAFCKEKNINNVNNEITLTCVPQNEIGPKSLIKLSNGAKTDYASVTWNPSLTEENTNFYLSINLNVDYVTFPEYDSTNNKWKFQMIFSNQEFPIGAKVKIDLKYNDNNDNVAICELIEDYIFECIPDVAIQNNNDKFSIIPEKNLGTVTFLNPEENLKFMIHLSYEDVKSFDLEQKNFEIKLAGSNMKNGNSIQLDILIDEVKNKSNCEFQNNILKCQFNYIEENIPKKVQLINDKTNEDFSWTNLENTVDLFIAEEPETTVVLIEETEANIIDTKIIKKSEVYGYYYNNEEKVFILDEDDYEDSDKNVEDEILKIIRNKLLNGEIKSSLLINGNYFFVEFNETKSVRYIISTTEEKNDNIPSINLDSCTSKIKETKGMSENTILYILYIEVIDPELNIPKTEYEIYSLSLENKYENINLEICKDLTVIMEVSAPANLTQEELDKYNSSSDFYNDVCYTYTTEQKTDIPMDDRRDEYLTKNYALCADNCFLSSYDANTGKAYCSCSISTEITSISDIKIDTKKLKSSFLHINNIANINILKCYKQLFGKDLGDNVGMIIITSIIGLSIISVLIFRFYAYNVFNTKMQDIIDIKKLENIDIKVKEEKVIEVKEYEYPSLNSNIQKLKNLKNFPPKKYLDSGNNIIEYNNNVNIGVKDISKASEKNRKDLLTKDDNKYTLYKNPAMNYNDSELNDLVYEDAIKHDTRGYLEYYLSLLKTKHLFIFSFITTKDYNSRTIKITLFFFTFAVNYTVNGLFFTDSTMHKIYKSGGGYDFSYHIAQIVYSTIISCLLLILVELIALSEDNVIKIRQAKKEELNEVIDKQKKYIFCKFITFYIVIFVFLLFFWYYVGCFCAVYKNTQIQLLKDTLISFCCSLLYPFIIFFLPGLFRIPAIKDEKKDSKYQYKFSKFVQFCV